MKGFCVKGVLAAALLCSAAARADAPDWRLYAADDSDSPRPGVVCISNGTWVVAASMYIAEAHKLRIETNGYENAYLNGVDNADTLDLRGTVMDATGGVWTITHIVQYALGADSVKGTAREFIAPTTLECGLWGWFNGRPQDLDGESIAEPVANYTNIVIDVPGWFQEIDKGQLPGTVETLNWDLTLPKLENIHAGALTESKHKAEIATQTGVFKTNSFLSVKTIGANALSNRRFSGCLNLPQVETIGNWGVSGNSGSDGKTGFTDIVLSPTAKTLRYLGDGCLGWNARLTNVVVGLAANNQVSHQIFNGCPNLSRVEFTGAPPNFTEKAGYSVFNAAARATTFIVPDADEWRDWLRPFEESGDFVRLSDEDVLAYHNANPDKPVRIGTVSTNVFRSAKEQYVAVAYDMAAVDEWVTYDSFFGDAVEIAFCDFAPVDGKLPLGSDYSATLVAKPNAARGGTFLGWYGDVPGGKVTNETVTVSLAYRANGRRPWLFARFAHPWTVTVEDDGKNAIADNGQFRIQATVLDSEGRTLQLARSSACSFYAPDNTGCGVCDLGGAVADASGAVWTFSELAWKGNAFASGKDDSVPGATALVTPGTLGSWPNSQIFHATSYRATYETIIIDEPTATGTLCGWMFSDQRQLRRFIVRAPKFDFDASLDGAFYGSKVRDTDMGWWSLDGLAHFGKVAANITVNFAGQNAGNGMHGALTLPSASVVGTRVFMNGDALSALALGTGGRKSRMTAIGDAAFQNCRGLTNVVINAAADLSVGEDAFAGASGLKTVTYLGPVVDEGAFGKLLAGVEASDADKPVRVYVSAFQGWAAAPYVSPVDESERAHLPKGERVIGVYRAGAAAPGGKAWICHRSSPFDPAGTMLLFR